MSSPAVVDSTEDMPGELVDSEPNAEDRGTDGVDDEALSAKGVGRLVAGNYRVAPGDSLDVLFHESWDAGADYHLLAGDELRVEFVSQPNVDGLAGLDRTLRIQPDGKLALPFLGSIRAAGATPSAFAEELTRRYSDLYVDPKVLVTLVSTGRGLTDLRESMKAAGGRSTVVAPDGTIRLPRIGMVSVADLTLKEIEDELNERFRLAVPGFHVTVRLAEGH